MNIRRRVVFSAPLLAMAVLVSACGSPAPPGQPPLAGARIGGAFSLVDQNGRPVTDRSFAGRYRIMYFGYTFCPDVCPVDVQVIGAAMRTLDKTAPGLAARVVPIFVTVDPARDTPAVVKSFVAAFHPRMVGLTGKPDAIAALAKAYGVYVAKGETSPGGGYMVDHTRTAYLMDPDGKPLALLPIEQGADAVAAEIQRWAK